MSKLPTVQQIVDDMFLKERELKNTVAHDVLKTAIQLAINYAGRSFVAGVLKREALSLDAKIRWNDKQDEQV